MRRKVRNGNAAVALEPTPVVDLRGPGADEEYPLGADPAHGEIADQLAALIQHRGECDAADLRHAIRHDVREPVLGATARDLELAVVGDLEQPHALAHGLTLGRDVRVCVRAVESDVLARLRGRQHRLAFTIRPGSD